MLKTEIIAWINNDRNFEVGLKLAEQAGTNAQMLRNFSIHPKVGKKKLYYLLKELAGLNSREPVAPKVISSQKPKPCAIPTPGNTQKGADTPDKSEFENSAIVIAAKRDADVLYKEMMNKRALLFNMCPALESKYENEGGKVKRRVTLTKEVMALDRKVNHAYDRYRFAMQNGYLPQEKEVSIETPPLLIAPRIANLKKAIRRLKAIKDPLTANQLSSLESKSAELQFLLKQYQDGINKL